MKEPHFHLHRISSSPGEQSAVHVLKKPVSKARELCLLLGIPNVQRANYRGLSGQQVLVPFSHTIKVYKFPDCILVCTFGFAKYYKSMQRAVTRVYNDARAGLQPHDQDVVVALDKKARTECIRGCLIEMPEPQEISL